MTKLEIQLERNSSGHFIYYPGHILNGVIELSLDAVKKVRGCYVLVYGYARAHWTETRTRTVGSGDNRRTESYTVHYEGKEVFLNSKTYMFGHHGAESREIQPGIHRYSFSCHLPDMLPYSMGAVHGCIEYSVEAVLDIPWRFDKETKVPFTVVRSDDLNLYPELRMAQKMDEVKTFCCLFCQSGPLMMTASVPHSGFAGGQRVPIRLEYSNRSNVKVEQTNIKLKRVMSFTSHSPERKTRYDTEKMIEFIIDGVCEDGAVELETTLEIPSIMMNSNARFCNVVRVEYYIEIEGVVGGCHSNPKIQIPITIGTVPIRLETGFTVPQNNIYPMPSAPSVVLPPAPSVVLPSAPMDDNNEQDLPPSFEEAMSMTKPQNSMSPPQSTSTSLGWNVLEPSVPNEKSGSLK